MSDTQTTIAPGGKLLADHQHPSRPLKPGVRYFVCPNDRELDPLPARAVAPKKDPYQPILAELLARGPGSLRELEVRTGLSQYRLNGALYQLRKQGLVTATERANPATHRSWRRGREYVYAVTTEAQHG